MKHEHSVVLDLFLGDSGKGKITDYLARTHLGAVRFNGSNNAGHTLYIDNVKYKTHAVPSGVLHAHTVNYIGHGCAINPKVLLKEIETFKHINPAIYISGQAHVVSPGHIALDIDRESKFGIGSTKQGVAPAYEAKAGRYGMRFEDLLGSREQLHAKVGTFPLSNDRRTDLLQLYDEYSAILKDHIIPDGVAFMRDLLKRGPVVFEGAQGCFLDVDVGPYPYVTASNCTIGAVLTGTGANLQDITHVIGVIKAYGSYVGTNADFADIVETDLNNRLCDLGQEYGATTGRRRRLCWLDLDKIYRAVEINGPTKLVITRMDTLGQLPVIRAKWQNKLIDFEPWGDISHIKNIADLPLAAQKYIDFVHDCLQVPIWAIGNGPNREDLLLRSE